MRALFSKGFSDCFIVGGAIRDTVLGRKVKDIDLVVPDPFSEKVEKIELLTGVKGVRINDLFNTVRFVSDEAILDVSVMQGDDITEDLKKRDFTINSMAHPMMHLEKEQPKSQLIDPMGGIGDIRTKLIRTENPENLSADPLRILRAFRFRTTLDFEIDGNTFLHCTARRALLRDVARERLRDELLWMLSGEGAGDALRDMCVSEILYFVIPEMRNLEGVIQNQYHHTDVLSHTIEAVENLERLTDGYHLLSGKETKNLRKWLEQSPSKNYTRESLLKLALLLHDIAKPATKRYDPSKRRYTFHTHEILGEEMSLSICEELRLSAKETEFETQLVRHHLRIGLLTEQEVTERALYRLFKALQDHIPDLVLISLADRLATRGHFATEEQMSRFIELCNQILTKFFSEETQTALKPLLSGDRVMDILGIPEGKLVGLILDALLQAQFEGRVKTEEEARDLILQIKKEGYASLGTEDY